MFLVRDKRGWCQSRVQGGGRAPRVRQPGSGPHPPADNSRPRWIWNRMKLVLTRQLFSSVRLFSMNLCIHGFQRWKWIIIAGLFPVGGACEIAAERKLEIEACEKKIRFWPPQRRHPVERHVVRIAVGVHRGWRGDARTDQDEAEENAEGNSMGWLSRAADSPKSIHFNAAVKLSSTTSSDGASASIR